MPLLYPLSSEENYVITAHVPEGLLLRPPGPGGPGSGSVPAKLFVKGGRIVHLQYFSAADKFPAGGGWKEIVIPPRQVLAPAFIDCHVHAALDGVNGFNGFQKPAEPQKVLEHLGRAAKVGVLAVRDGSDRFNSALVACRSGEPPPSPGPLPALVATGSAIFRQGCYGSFLAEKGITSIKEVYYKLQQLANMGADQLKVVLSGLVSFRQKGTVNGPLQFSLPEMEEMVKAASRFGLRVMVHASSDRAARLAAEAGVHSIEHGYFITPETLELMAERQVAWVPTVAPLFAVLENAPAGNTPAINRDAVAHAVEHQLEMIHAAHRSGVLLGLGSDAGSPGVGWDNGVALEMGLFARAGLNPVEILKVASQNGSRVLGLTGTMGALQEGLLPCFVCLDRNFLIQPGAHLKPEAVIFPSSMQTSLPSSPSAPETLL